MSKLTLHDFKFLRDAFPEIQLPDSWGMTTSEKDDVIWNIVLAYLNSFPPSDEGELAERVEYLTGPLKMEDFKISIEMCNPFLRRDPCLHRLVTRFKNKVEIYIQSGKLGFQKEPKNFRYLEASSELLECKIVLISFLPQDQILVNVFPVKTDQKTSTIVYILNEITFVRRNEILEKFSFCMPKEIGIQKQTQALAKVLEGTKAFERRKNLIQIVTSLPDITENFLISLLKSNLRSLILLVYESPCVLSQLADACFETDPRTKDSAGKSAFLHALKTEESQLVFLLYDHAARARSTSCHDPEMVGRLQCLKDDLKGLKKDLESQEISEESRRLFTYLCRFNEFQIEMCKSIMDIRLKDYDDYTEEERDFLQRKEILLAILNTYEAYFHSTNAKSTADAVSRFKEFYEHKNYFDKIDFFSAVMFFCNLFRLKEEVISRDLPYLGIESDFFLSIFSRKHWEKYEKQNRFYFASRWIKFQERLLLQNQIKSLKETLAEEKLPKLTNFYPTYYLSNNLLHALPWKENETLRNLLYEHLLLYRLQRYLNAATQILIRGDLKSILVIERCLQVISESCNKYDFGVGKIIRLVLPENIIMLLEQIHNHSSHMKSRELLYRYNLEEDKQLFIGIQKELTELKKFLSPLYSYHKYKMDGFLLSRFEKFATEAQKKEQEYQLEYILKSLEGKNNRLRKATGRFRYRSDRPFRDMDTAMKLIDDLNLKGNVLDESTAGFYKEIVHLPFQDMRNKLEMDIDDLNCKGNVLDESTAGFCKRIVQNLLSAIEVKIKCLKASDAQKAVEEMENDFSRLEQILTYITTDVKFTRHRSSLIYMSEDRKKLIRKLGENAMQPQKAEKSKINRKESRGSCVFCKSRDNFEGKIQTEETDSAIDQTNSKPYRQQVTVPPEIKKSKGLIIVWGIACCKIECSLTECLNNYKIISANILRKVKQENSKEDLLFKNIEIYCWIIKELQNLKKEKKRREEISKPRHESEHYQSAPEPKRNVEDSSGIKTKNGLAKLNQTNCSPFPTLKEIVLKNLGDISGSIGIAALLYSLDLIPMARPEELDERKCMPPTKNLEISDILLNSKYDILLNSKKTFLNGVSNDRFEFLRNRIKILKKILIEDNVSIQRLWDKASTPRKKACVREKIAELYLEDSEIQASVEMILFHCKTILFSKELEELWKKTTNLFNDINLRSSILHDHPPLVSISRKLDLCDLSSELVDKMLKLISDENVIECMHEILEQFKTIKNNQADFSDFMTIMDESENNQFNNLCNQIRKCQHWKQYALLIPFYK